MSNFERKLSFYSETDIDDLFDKVIRPISNLQRLINELKGKKDEESFKQSLTEKCDELSRKHLNTLEMTYVVLRLTRRSIKCQK